MGGQYTQLDICKIEGIPICQKMERVEKKHDAFCFVMLLYTIFPWMPPKAMLREKSFVKIDSFLLDQIWKLTSLWQSVCVI